MRRVAWALAAVALGCTTSQGHRLGTMEPPQVGEPPPILPDDKAEAAYQEVLDRYSRHAELFAGPEGGEDTRMFCAATYQSMPFREARVRRAGAFRAEPEAEVEKKLAAEKAEADQFDDFFFGAHLVDYKMDDFDKHNSVWRIALVGEGVEETPVLIERVGRSTSDTRAMYPYMGEFWAGYRIRFNKLAQGRGDKIMLRLASSVGRVELTVPAQ